MKSRFFTYAFLCCLLASCVGDSSNSGNNGIDPSVTPTQELSDTTKAIVSDFINFMFENEVLAVPDNRPIQSDSSSALNVNSSVKNTFADTTKDKVLSWVKSKDEHNEQAISSKTVNQTGSENEGGRISYTNHASEVYPDTVIDGYVDVTRNSSNFSISADVTRSFNNASRGYNGKTVTLNGFVNRTLNGTVTLVPMPPEPTESISIDFIEKVQSMDITLSGDVNGTIHSNIQVHVKAAIDAVSANPLFECTGKFVYTSGTDVEVCNIRPNCFGCL